MMVNQMSREQKALIAEIEEMISRTWEKVEREMNRKDREYQEAAIADHQTDPF